MKGISELLGRIFPDFQEARQERRKVRRRARANLRGVERGDEVILFSTQSDTIPYLDDKTEKIVVNADHLVKSYGSRSGSFSYTLRSNEDELEEALESIISNVNRQNRISIIFEIFFILFVVVCLSVSTFLGFLGIEGIISAVGEIT